MLGTRSIEEMIMTKFVTTSTAVAALALAFASSAHAQAASQTKLDCTEVTNAVPADGGYKRVGVRAPKANVNGQRVTAMAVLVSMPVAQARTDAGLEEPKIGKLFDCKGRTGFYAKVEQQPDFDATEIVLPENISKGTKIEVCSNSVGCASGVFEDFTKWVTLTPGGAPSSAAKIAGKYN